jgi:serine phosphatase RsbU (regulator of sigma subunit)
MPIAFAIGLYAWVGRNKRPPGLNRLTSWSFGIYSAALLCCLYTLEFDIFNSLLLCGCAAGFIVALDIVIRSLRKRMHGSVIAFTGGLVFTCTFTINFWFEYSSSEHFSYFFYSLGHIALILSLSCQLARIVGNTGRSLQIELERVETLSQTNIEQERALRQRMEDELEEAHQLQISMLPDHIPEHPSAEVNWSMKTATEVGGDYYDYRITDDDRLTLVLGDATGHGMQAGTLVTATKSLFQSLTTEGNLADTVSKMSVNLKSMNLHRLGMALTLLELDGHRLRYCAAGIPPMLVYRAKEDTVEEGETGGLPLGLTTRGNYHQTELTLESGDALLLMSDGLAERTNEAEEEFGYQRVQDLFHEVATDTPAEICRKMAAGGDAWAAGKEQDDDVSFLAVRLR